MSSSYKRDRKVPHLPDSVRNPASIGLDETKRAAWAFAIGEIRPSADPPAHRRMSRADLPDVDFSRAVPVDARPSLLRRLARWLGLASNRPAVLADEWRVMRSESTPAEPVRPRKNVIPINRAA